jgi:two-component system sensor histidine kinase VicK
VVETASGRLLELDGIHASEGQSALLLLQDVTSRERQRRAERDFVTNAAHELKTPIAAIASSLEVLQGGAKETPEDRDLFLGHLEHESDRLARLVAALLLLARIQTGQATPSLELADLAPLLEDIALRMRPKPGVEVHVSCDQGVAAFVDVDLLRQVVWNLAVNSTNHTHHGEIVLSGRDLGRLSEIEVRDSGSGIAEDQQSLVFDRFFRAEQHSAAGFGLGLPLVREIVGALGGSVSLDSQLGEGTRVRVLVPSARLVRA